MDCTLGVHQIYHTTLDHITTAVLDADICRKKVFKVSPTTMKLAASPFPTFYLDDAAKSDNPTPSSWSNTVDLDAYSRLVLIRPSPIDAPVYLVLRRSRHVLSIPEGRLSI